MAIDESVYTSLENIQANAVLIDAFTNGTAAQTVQLGTGDPTPCLRKFIADAQMEAMTEAEVAAIFD